MDGGENRRDASFEALEARLVLSAPTITPLPPTVTTTRVLLPVQYHSDSPIDLSTIGDGDIGATGPDGFAQLARLFTAPVVLSNGDVVAVYALTAPGGQWNWPNANGTYNVGVAGDAVRNTAGEGIAPGGAGSYWLWFNTDHVTMTDQHIYLGSGLPPQGTVGQDAWVFSFHVAGPIPRYASGAALVVHITGPNGFDAAGYATDGILFHYGEPPMSTEYSATINAPGGAWDFGDSGVYTVQIGTPTSQFLTPPTIDELIMTQTYTQIFAAPRAQLVASNIRVHDWLLTMRYDAAPGASINISSVSNSDISVMVPGQGELLGALSGRAVQNLDGSVTAVYRVTSTSPGGWSQHNNSAALIHTRFNQVLDSAGRPVGAGQVAMQELLFDAPSVTGLRTISANVAAWDVEVSFNNVGGLIQTSSLSGQNLLVYNSLDTFALPAPMRIQLLSFANSADNVLTARYRISAQQGALPDATYHILLNGTTVLLGSPTDYLPISTLANVNMHFAAPAVLGVHTLSRTSGAWDIELDLSNPASLINTSSVGTQNLIITPPSGRSVRLVMISFANGADHVLRVRYRILPMTAGASVPLGMYSFALRADSVMAAGMGGLPGQFIASLTI
jgi:hypothetical protein